MNKAQKPYSSNSNLSVVANNKGQIIIEYMLLLIVAVTIATLIVSRVSSRSDDNPGFLIIKWRTIIQTIGVDNVESI